MSRAQKQELKDELIENLKGLDIDLNEVSLKIGISKIHITRLIKEKEISKPLLCSFNLLIENQRQKKEIETLKKEIEILRSLLKS